MNLFLLELKKSINFGEYIKKLAILGCVVIFNIYPMFEFLIILFYFFGLVQKLLIIIKFWGENKWFLMWLFDFSHFYENYGYMFLGLFVLYFILRIVVIKLGNHGSYNHPKIKIKELLVLVIPKFFT